MLTGLKLLPADAVLVALLLALVLALLRARPLIED